METTNTFDGQPEAPQYTVSEESRVSGKKTSFVLPFVVVLCALVFGTGGYFLGINTEKNSARPEQPQRMVEAPAPPALPSPADTMPPAPSPFTEVIALPEIKLPAGWRKVPGKCGVIVALPPKKAPYLGKNGENWDAPRGGVYPELLTNFIKIDRIAYEQTTAMYAQEQAGNDQLLQAVAVTCLTVPNIKTAQDIKDKVPAAVAAMNAAQRNSEFIGGGVSTLKSAVMTQRWGKDVVDVTLVKDGKEQLLTLLTVSENKVIEVSTSGISVDPFVRQTAAQIKDLLSFE